MKRKLIEHLLSIAVVAAIFIALIISLGGPDRQLQEHPSVDSLEEYLSIAALDFGDPLDRALFKETVDAFFPALPYRGDSLLHAIDAFRRERFTNELYKTGSETRGLTPGKLTRLGVMYLQFIGLYLVVLSLSYYGAQTLGIMRFVKMKQGTSSSLGQLVRLVLAGRSPSTPLPGFILSAGSLVAKAVANGVAQMILFSPAYVIAYSIKTKFETDSYLFMVVLGVVSNGLLINYANKFFIFLVSESRRGYVETAVVKNLHNDYAWDVAEGIRLTSVFRLRKSFPRHVFQHIYLNAHYQFVSSMKEHASFIITGLVIIEMALNFQGHFSYELLKNLLYKEYDVVLSIILAMFVLVKLTDITVDVWAEHLAHKYENLG